MSRGLGDVYKRQSLPLSPFSWFPPPLALRGAIPRVGVTERLYETLTSPRSASAGYHLNTSKRDLTSLCAQACSRSRLTVRAYPARPPPPRSAPPPLGPPLPLFPFPPSSPLSPLFFTSLFLFYGRSFLSLCTAGALRAPRPPPLYHHGLPPLPPSPHRSRARLAPQRPPSGSPAETPGEVRLCAEMTWLFPRDRARMYIIAPGVGTEEAAFFSPFPLQVGSLVLPF